MMDAETEEERTEEEEKEEKTPRQIITGYAHDTVFALALGLVISLIMGAVFGVIAFVVGGFSLYSALSAVRGGLLIIGAITLFITATFLLSRKSNTKIRGWVNYKSRIRIMGPAGIAFLASVVMLALGSVVDYIVFYL